MLIGMALLKWRVVTAELPEKVYGALARIGFGFGLPCTLIFYGHGLGFYMHVSRPGQLAVTLAVWIMLLVAAPLWLARFRFEASFATWIYRITINECLNQQRGRGAYHIPFEALLGSNELLFVD